MHFCLAAPRREARRGNRELRIVNSELGKPLGREFYEQDAEPLARALLGKIIVRGKRRARIVETEAYVGPHDLASHSSKGRTARTEVMFGQAGHAYIYFIYGMYNMFNIVAGGKCGQAVLIRAAEAMDGWEADLTGPGKLCRELGITRADNAADLTKGRFFLEDGAAPRLGRTRRIGVDYAKKWKHTLLRFYDRDSDKVCKHPRPSRVRS
jgi:DNA-3-methyladenine glycosylase